MRLFKIFLFSVFLLLPIKTVIPQVQPVRTVTLKVAVDEEYRKKGDWSTEVSRIVASTSKVFEKNFGIRFEIKNMGFWISKNSHISMMVLLNDLQGSVPHKECDIVLGFTGQHNLNNDFNGVASYLNSYILLRDVEFISTKRNTLLHELCHIFGAIDLNEQGSVMSTTRPDLRFNKFTIDIIQLNRLRHFNPYIFPLPKERLDEALSLYKQRKSLNRQELDVHIVLALIHLERENYTPMIRESLRAVEIDSNSPDGHNLLGIAYRRTGKINQAIEHYSKVLELQPNKTEVHYNLGIAYMKKSLNEKAIDEYKKAIELDPKFAKAYSNLGHLYLEMRHVDFAIVELRKALFIYPELPEALATLGAALIAKRQYKEAEEVSLKSLRIDPGLSGAHNNLGSVYMNENLVGKAIEEYLKAIDLNPSFHQAFYNLGRVYLTVGKTESAIETFKKAISLVADYHEAYSNLASAYIKMGLIEEALSASEKAIALKPDYAIAHFNRASAYFAIEMFKQAEEEARKAIEFDSLLADPYNLLGILWEREDKTADAQTAYESAVRLKPDFVEAQMNLANFFYKQNHFFKAAASYERVIAIDPRNAQAYNNIAVVYFRLEKYSEALSHLKKAESLGFQVHPDFKSSLLKKIKKTSKPYFQLRGTAYLIRIMMSL